MCLVMLLYVTLRCRKLTHHSDLKEVDCTSVSCKSNENLHSSLRNLGVDILTVEWKENLRGCCV